MPRADIYAARLAARRCQDCNAGLQATDTLRCVECAARRSFRLSTKAQRRRRRRWFRERGQSGLCLDCARPAALGRKRCEEHLAHRKEAVARYLDRKESANANP